jgi:hypothetical protein
VSEASSSTSSSERPLRATLIAGVLALAGIVAIEAAYRTSGGFPTVYPGWTPVEYQWRAGRTVPSRSAIVVGDSRVGWGVAESEATAALEDTGWPGGRVRNLGFPAASITELLWAVLGATDGEEPGALVVAFSPGSFYFFAEDPGEPIADLKLQDYLDARIVADVSEVLTSYGKGAAEIHAQVRRVDESRRSGVGWVRRTVFSEGFVNAELRHRDGRPVDGSEYQLQAYEEVLDWLVENPEAVRARRRAIVDTLRWAGERGWDVSIARLPVGERMRAIEERLPGEYGPEAVALDAGVRFHDYDVDPRTAGLPSQDESHLTPDAARQFSRVLGADLGLQASRTGR